MYLRSKGKNQNTNNKTPTCSNKSASTCVDFTPSYESRCKERARLHDERRKKEGQLQTNQGTPSTRRGPSQQEKEEQIKVHQTPLAVSQDHTPHCVHRESRENGRGENGADVIDTRDMSVGESLLSGKEVMISSTNVEKNNEGGHNEKTSEVEVITNVESKVGSENEGGQKGKTLDVEVTADVECVEDGESVGVNENLGSVENSSVTNAMVEVIQDSVIVETNNRGTQSVPSENDGGQNGKTVNVECIEEGGNVEVMKNLGNVENSRVTDAMVGVTQDSVNVEINNGGAQSVPTLNVEMTRNVGCIFESENARTGKELFNAENVGTIKELLKSKVIVEHHLSYAEECVEKSIYPLGLKTFVPCVAYRADNELKKRWKQILHNTSLELLATLRAHFRKLLNKYTDQIMDIENEMERTMREEDTIKWQEEKAQLQIELKTKECEMKDARKKKIKHAEKIHKEGRVFVESCLIERNNVAGGSRRENNPPRQRENGGGNHETGGSRVENTGCSRVENAEAGGRRVENVEVSREEGVGGVRVENVGGSRSGNHRTGNSRVENTAGSRVENAAAGGCRVECAGSSRVEDARGSKLVENTGGSRVEGAGGRKPRERTEGEKMAHTKWSGRDERAKGNGWEYKSRTWMPYGRYNKFHPGWSRDGWRDEESSWGSQRYWQQNGYQGWSGGPNPYWSWHGWGPVQSWSKRWEGQPF